MFNSLYYKLKPFIPRRLQIAVRRHVVQRQRVKYRDIWPIDPAAGEAPEGWPGWPDGKQFALVLTHDVESAPGLEKVLTLARLEQKMGFRSCFNFVGQDYPVYDQVRKSLIDMGFEIGLHGLTHKGNLFRSKRAFGKQCLEINSILKEWGSIGFRTPSLYHNLDWIHEMKVEYDSSTFDTDPFEPQPDGAGTIFPFWVPGKDSQRGYVELPYTLPQDFTLFVLMGERNIGIWKRKVAWVANHGGMALLITHPDYMNSEHAHSSIETYPTGYYEELLHYIKQKYDGQYWNVLPRDIVSFFRKWSQRDVEDS